MVGCHWPSCIAASSSSAKPELCSYISMFKLGNSRAQEAGHEGQKIMLP